MNPVSFSSIQPTLSAVRFGRKADSAEMNRIKTAIEKSPHRALLQRLSPEVVMVQDLRKMMPGYYRGHFSRALMVPFRIVQQIFDYVRDMRRLNRAFNQNEKAAKSPAVFILSYGDTDGFKRAAMKSKPSGSNIKAHYLDIPGEGKQQLHIYTG